MGRSDEITAKLNKNDRELLVSLADYRLLTMGQVSALCEIGKAATRKRVKKLTAGGLAEVNMPATCRTRGRPEGRTSLTNPGIDLLRDEKLISRVVPHKQITATGIRCADHLLAINWVRVHLVYLERTVSRLNVRFWSSESPFVPRGLGDTCGISDHAPTVRAGGEPIAFTPDGAFSITDKGSGQALLFFLEMDMGTETLSGAGGGSLDVHQKIVTYQQYFRSCGYKRYEELWDCEFTGFRLLFVSNTSKRLDKLCRLVHATPPRAFIWLTDLDRLFTHGMSGNIWVAGGDASASPTSIVGKTMARACPIPGVIS